MKVFVTGTDTGVGKTVVTAALVRHLRAAGRDARAVKPLETGWEPATSDARALADASQRRLEDTVFRTFAEPRAPRAAARLASAALSLDEVVAWCQEQAGDPLLIEGAGGWAVPIDHRTMGALAVAAADRTLIVARAGLGTINHAVLTADAVARATSLAGVVLSCRPDDDLDFAEDNAAEIAALIAAPVALYPRDLIAIAGWLDGPGR